MITRGIKDRSFFTKLVREKERLLGYCQDQMAVNVKYIS